MVRCSSHSTLKSRLESGGQFPELLLSAKLSKLCVAFAESKAWMGRDVVFDSSLHLVPWSCLQPFVPRQRAAVCSDDSNDLRLLPQHSLCAKPQWHGSLQHGEGLCHSTSCLYKGYCLWRLERLVYR